jgi:hypothetical protein
MKYHELKACGPEIKPNDDTSAAVGHNSRPVAERLRRKPS